MTSQNEKAKCEDGKGRRVERQGQRRVYVTLTQPVGICKNRQRAKRATVAEERVCHERTQAHTQHCKEEYKVGRMDCWENGTQEHEADEWTNEWTK